MKAETKQDIGRVRFNSWIWQTASQFNQAADTLFEGDLVNHTYPILMNYAFACELALKACAVQTRYNCKPLVDGIIPTASFKSTAHGHDLGAVFGQLPSDTRDAVSNAYNNITGENLSSQLAEFKDYFVDVRYSFEQRPRSYDLTGLRRLANGLVEAVFNAAKTTEGF